jgi:hypothetical protein
MGRIVRPPLAAHLAHADSDAWFDLIALGASLPTSLCDANEEGRLKYIHEYVHFLQATSTFFGANRMHTFFWTISGLRKLLLACDGKLSLLDIPAYTQQVQIKLDGLDQITRASLIEGQEEQFIANTEHEGFQQVDTDEAKFPAFLRRIDTTKVSVSPIGIKALQESMALAVERWIEPTITQRTYEAAAKPEYWYHFEYISVPEALRSFANWNDETINWVTVVLCDVALDHYLPLHAFTLAVAHLRKHHALAAPSIDHLAQLHAELRACCHIDLAELDRASLIQELTRVVNLPDQDSAPSDLIFARYFRTYLNAFSVRAQKPHAFVERLLFLEAGCPSDLKEFESIPFYFTKNGVVSSQADTNLVTAGLAVLCMRHFSEYLISSGAQNPDASALCPLFEMPGVCEYAKGEHCHKQPWLAPEEDGQSCVYRFAADALGVKSE